MGEGKILIMGAGGCGSGFIIRCLENCGLDNGGYNSYLQHGPVRKLITQGVDPKNIDMPRVIKHLGGFMLNLNEHIKRYGWEIEHIFFAVTAYELQIYKYQKRRGIDRKEADARYRKGLANGILQLIEGDHPFTIVKCPDSILSPEYMYRKMKIVLPKDFTFEDFKAAHAKTVLPKYLKRLQTKMKEVGYA